MKNKFYILIIFVALVGVLTHAFTPHTRYEGKICLTSDHLKDCCDSNTDWNDHQDNASQNTDECKLIKISKSNKTQSNLKPYLYPSIIPFSVKSLFNSQLLDGICAISKKYITNQQIIISFLCTESTILRAPPSLKF